MNTPRETPSPARRARILFFSEAVSLAHVARPVVLATALPAERFEILFASADEFTLCHSGARYLRQPIRSIPPALFMQRLARGAPVYTCEELLAYVEEDRRVIGQFRPDVVIGDFRLSLSISCRLTGVPLVNLSNAYWSPRAWFPDFPLPAIPLSKWLGRSLAQFLFNAFRPMAFRYHARPMNRARRHHGLPPLADLRDVYTDGDWTLYADPPGLVPMHGFAPHERTLGPILWSPEIGLPAWWQGLPADRPVLYLTLGSSGAVEFLEDILARLGRLPIRIMVATAGRHTPRSARAAIHCADFLPGQAAAARSALVISNGGSATSYQALAAGVPVIGVCSNLDQFLSMDCIARAGAGISLRAEKGVGRRLEESVLAMLTNPRYRHAAGKLAQTMSNHPAPINFTRFMDEILAGILDNEPWPLSKPTPDG